MQRVGYWGYSCLLLLWRCSTTPTGFDRDVFHVSDIGDSTTPDRFVFDVIEPDVLTTDTLQVSCSLVDVVIPSQDGATGELEVLQLALGQSHTCALMFDHTVRCWGANTSGQLGSGDTATKLRPVTVSGLQDIVQIAAGAQHTCALNSSGQLYCWGLNDGGQLGDGTIEDHLFPTLVNLPSVQRVVIGQYHTCAIVTGGALYCWGHNETGQIGNSFTGNVRTPIGILTGGSVAEVTLGSFHTCSLSTMGEILCWGLNHAGQLGNCSTENHSIPMRVPSTLVRGATRLTAGYHHVCVLAPNETVLCWGDHHFGQIGVTETTGCLRSSGRVLSQYEPTQVLGLSAITSVSAGDLHNCVINQTGEVLCWGDNRYGQLGDCSFGQRPTPRLVNSLNNIVEIKSGSRHVCVRDQQNHVQCWGANEHGQLGIGSTLPQGLPIHVPIYE